MMKFIKRINKTFKALAEILKNPWLLNNVLDDNIVWDKYLNKKYSISHGLALIDFKDLNPQPTEEVKIFSFLDGGSLPTDIALLQILSKKFNNCRYFEIGTWRGESVVNVSRFAKECYTLNLSDDQLIQKGANKKYIELQGFYSKGKENIIHLKGDSTNYDYQSIGKKFDLIFIDGDHHYESVKKDTEKIFENLVHDQSIVVWHDYAFSPEKVRSEVLAGILDGTPEEFRKNLYHVSNTLCAVFIRGNFKSSTLESPVKPDKKFSVTINIEKVN